MVSVAAAPLNATLAIQEFGAGHVDQFAPEMFVVGADGKPTLVPSPAFHFRIRSVAVPPTFSTNATFVPSSERTTEVTAVPVPV